MVLVDSQNIAIFADAVSLSDTGAVGKGWVCGAYTIQNATLLDVAAPMTWIGGAWKWENGGWVAHNQTAIDAEIARIAEVERKARTPQSITSLQAKLQLNRIGMLDQVDALILADKEVSLYWEYALEIQREHPILLQMATTLGLTDTQVDEMFIEASRIK